MAVGKMVAEFDLEASAGCVCGRLLFATRRDAASGMSCCGLLRPFRSAFVMKCAALKRVGVVANGVVDAMVEKARRCPRGRSRRRRKKKMVQVRATKVEEVRENKTEKTRTKRSIRKSVSSWLKGSLLREALLVQG